MHVWPTDPGIDIEQNRQLSRDKSHSIQLTTIHCGSHTGTHLDAPVHMIGSDAKTLNDIPLEQLIGPVRVVDLPGRASIGTPDLELHDWRGVDRVLFRTDNSGHWKDLDFWKDFVYLEPGGARFLVRRGIRLVGIDYLSIDPYGSADHPSHFVLLEHSVVILEGLNLIDVEPGDYELVALPIRLDRADGAPVRAILRN